MHPQIPLALYLRDRDDGAALYLELVLPEVGVSTSTSLKVAMGTMTQQRRRNIKSSRELTVMAQVKNLSEISCLTSQESARTRSGTKPAHNLVPTEGSIRW